MPDDDVQYIKLPDGSYGKFRMDAKDEDIKAAISKDFPDAFKPPPPKQSYLQQALTGGLQSMNPGISSPGASPATDPETASAMQQGAMAGGLAAMPIAGGLRAGAAGIARTLIGSGIGATGGEHLGRALGSIVGEGEAGATIGRTAGALYLGAKSAKGIDLPEGSRYSFLNKFLGTPNTEAAFPVSKSPGPYRGPRSVPQEPIVQSMKESPYANQQAAVTKAATRKAAQLSDLAEEQRIVSPDSPPPPINRTLVSYDAKTLLKGARAGNIDYINELIRNPRGIDLEEALPNVKFLYEGGRPIRIYGGPGSTK